MERNKAKKRARQTNITEDWAEFREKHRRFAEENRRRRRNFLRRTEIWICNCNNSELAEVMKSNKKRRDKRERASTTRGEPLDPARFTRFMGEFHEHNQTTLNVSNFETPTETKAQIELCIREAKRCESLGIDGVHNEVLQMEPELMPELI